MFLEAFPLIFSFAPLSPLAAGLFLLAARQIGVTRQGVIVGVRVLATIVSVAVVSWIISILVMGGPVPPLLVMVIGLLVFAAVAGWLASKPSRRRIGDHLKGWREACASAGVPGLLFHDSRRSAVRNMVRAGIPEKIAMEISGHKTRAIFERYNIISQRDLKLAAEKLERYFTSLGTPADTRAIN